MHFNDFYLPCLGSQFRRQDKLDTGQSWEAPGSSQDRDDIQTIEKSSIYAVASIKMSIQKYTRLPHKCILKV